MPTIVNFDPRPTVPKPLYLINNLRDAVTERYNNRL